MTRVQSMWILERGRFAQKIQFLPVEKIHSLTNLRAVHSVQTELGGVGSLSTEQSLAFLPRVRTSNLTSVRSISDASFKFPTRKRASLYS